MSKDDDDSQEEEDTLSRRTCAEEEEERDGIVRGGGGGRSQRPSSSSLVTTIMTKPAILCLLATETAERFAFNGFRALLVLYLVQELDYSESTAVAIFSYSNSLAYFTPILGACLADGPWGRYPVIARGGTLYLLGLIVLTAAAAMAVTSTEEEQQQQEQQGALLEWKRTGSFAGLFLVCLATGGIKPVVSVSDE
jgi:dipeptide/tripeptide permease